MIYLSDDSNELVPVSTDRFEHLLYIEALYDRAISELCSDIKIHNRDFLFRHEILMVLGAYEEAEKMRRKEKEYEDSVRPFDDSAL